MFWVKVSVKIPAPSHFCDPLVCVYISGLSSSVRLWDSGAAGENAASDQFMKNQHTLLNNLRNHSCLKLILTLTLNLSRVTSDA